MKKKTKIKNTVKNISNFSDVSIFLYSFICPEFNLYKYESRSILTSFESISKPITLGKAIASIIISEKSKTAPNLTEEPITMKIKNNNLYEYSENLLFPNKNVQDLRP